MKLVFHYEAGAWLRARLADLAADGLECVAISEQDDAGLAAEIVDAESLCHVLKPVTAAILDAAPRLRLVQKIGVGVNTIDLDAAKARGVAVCNMPGTNTVAVAEATLALMLAALRRIGSFERRLRRDGAWALPPEWQGGLGETAGRVVGLVGWGAVPRRLAPILSALGATVVVHARRPDATPGVRFVDKATLLCSADIVSLHLPETPETVGFLDRDAIAAMKPGAILVNTARGRLVDEGALIEALGDGRIGGAGLDVFAAEPIDPRHPLLAMETVVVTPHVAWATRETLERSLAVVVENARRLASGEPLLHRVA